MSAPTITGTTPTSTDRVKGTTFDGCTAPTDAELTSWGVDPTRKENLKDVPFGQNGRGCLWFGAQWALKIYAIDVSPSQLDKPHAQFDRQERIQIGPRLGWLFHTKNFISCSVAIPSGESVATVQVDLKTDLTDQHYDQCPLAVKIITQLESRIP